MKEPGIYSALSLSFFLHMAVITLSFYLGRDFYTHRALMQYDVSLISPSQLSESEKGPGSSAAPKPAEQQIEKQVEKTAETPRAEKPQVQMHTETRQQKRADTSIINERINELKAIQKLERLAALRKTIDVGAGPQARLSRTSPGSGNSGGSSGGTNDYYAIVGGKIRQQWIFPDTLHADLETDVAIKIAADGKITIEKVEKSSGNPLFDRSVLRAINMASPLPPPLKEMEIGIHFRPQ